VLLLALIVFIIQLCTVDLLTVNEDGTYIALVISFRR